MDYTTYTVHTHSHATHRAAAAGAAEAEHPERPGERRAKRGAGVEKNPESGSSRTGTRLQPRRKRGLGGRGVFLNIYAAWTRRRGLVS